MRATSPRTLYICRFPTSAVHVNVADTAVGTWVPGVHSETCGSGRIVHFLPSLIFDSSDKIASCGQEDYSCGQHGITYLAGERAVQRCQREVRDGLRTFEILGMPASIFATASSVHLFVIVNKTYVYRTTEQASQLDINSCFVRATIVVLSPAPPFQASCQSSTHALT